jgi:hypothetical protein
MNMPNKRSLAKLLIIASSVTLWVGVHITRVDAQTPTASFALIGHIEELTVANPNDALSKGTLKVNGITVTLPKNLLIKFPGQYLTISDIFRGRKPITSRPPLPAAVVRAAPKTSSGIALKDPPAAAGQPRFIAPFEVEVLGNITFPDGDTTKPEEYVAGWVAIAQIPLNTGAGYIKRIDAATGAIFVGPKSGPEMATVRINDPTGMYGKPNSEKGAGDVMDERFAVDPGNAPVTAQTGFPMCLPTGAADPKCPASNRPASAALRSRFTCGTTAATFAIAPPDTGCNANLKAPLMVGDYITYAGALAEEVPGSNKFFVAAHAIQAAIGIYTSPGIDPAYVLIEEAIIGAIGERFPPPFENQEETGRFRIVGFTTDPTRNVEVLAMDRFVATGETERAPPLVTLPPSRLGQIGRIRTEPFLKANFLPVPRDIRIRIVGHTSTKTAAGNEAGSGLDSGQYTAPVGEYIVPENTRWGIPNFAMSAPFENFCFLSKGGGALDTLGRDRASDTDQPNIGRLVPFPLSGHPKSQTKADNVTRACPGD